MSTKEPIVHVTTGTSSPSTSSVAVRVDSAVSPEATVRVSGLKVTTGGVASLAMETVSVTGSAAFPAASVAVAVHVAAVSTLTTGAV